MSELPQHIGRYSVEELIGEGGTARVYRGTAQSASGFTKDVAIKVLRPHLRGDARFERMLISEAKWGGTLSHDGLVPVYELGLHDGSYFLCMEYVHGVTLREFMDAGPLAKGAAIFFVSRLAAVLDYLHNFANRGEASVGLVHRDITPSNVLVSPYGQVKLVDFGIAKATALSSETQGNLLKGTYAYMSPEQVAGDTLDSRSDIFSLGSLFYELLTTKRTFDGDTVHETMRRVRDAEWSWPDDSKVDAETRAIVERCLEPESERRWPSAEAVFGALEALPDARSFSSIQLRTSKAWASHA